MMSPALWKRAKHATEPTGAVPDNLSDSAQQAERFSTLEDWLAWLERHHPKAIELGLERVNRVAGALGILPFHTPVVTVAGTNGKGSTIAALSAVLSQSGNAARTRLGIYTSPHLLEFNERIVIAGEPASDAQLLAAFEEVNLARYAAGEQPVSLTYFEFTTLAALLLFARADLDYVLLEVGLGGRLDAVNIVDADVAVITQVAMDHEAWLGDTREKIGAEKAGILRPGQRVVLAEPEPPASVMARAQQLGCEVYVATPSTQGAGQHGLTITGDEVRWEGSGPGGEPLRRDSLPAPVIAAANLSAALQAAALLTPLPAAARLADILDDVRPPGRLSHLRYRSRDCVLDVAHNPAAVRRLAEHLRGGEASSRWHLVFAVMADKDIAGMLAELGECDARWYLPALSDVERACDPATLAALLPAGSVACGGGTVAESLDQAVHNAAHSDKIIVFGSFFLVAEALQHLGYTG